jgi:hypothetical protein
MAIIRNMSGSMQIILFCATIFIISSIAIFLPYYYANYKPSQKDKHNLINSFCNVLNQTYQYKYSCVKKFYQCGCDNRYYYPCDYYITKYIEGYCCDPICYKNTSLNSLNFITCGYDTIITSIIRNTNNITNTFIETCKFNDDSCINYWIGLKQNQFECYYYITDIHKILLSKPDFVELYSVGFIFAYVFAGIGILLMILLIIKYNKNNNQYISLN